MNSSLRPALLSLLLLSLAGCGGGGSSNAGSNPANGTAALADSGSITPVPIPGNDSVTPAPTTGSGDQQAAMTMSCAEGAGYQCSGGTVLRTDNGVALTSSGVQAYGRSANESAPDRNSGVAAGMMPASGGVADIQVAKDANGIVSKPVLQLKNLNISWDRRNDRPPIIETFSLQQGRVQLDASGRAVLGPLPDSSNTDFYDWVKYGINGTQANYANNVYFPRTDPPRCPATVVPCLDYETKGFSYSAGNWRGGGIEPDFATVQRLHSDGDLQAGDGVPGADGKGTPYPGFKGYRSFDNYGLQYANLGAWVTQDTVSIVEWVGQGGDEHNNNRRGMVAYGDVTAPSAVPTAGTASYAGVAYGWYVPDGTQDVAYFRGDVSVTADFAARRSVVTVQNTRTYDSAGTPLPVALTANAAVGAAGQPIANYLTGAVDNGTLKGGLGGRFFGPVISGGAGGSGPVEIAGTFTLSNAATGQTAIGGFIARKQ